MKPRLDPKRDLAGATPETLARALSICQRSFISPFIKYGKCKGRIPIAPESKKRGQPPVYKPQGEDHSAGEQVDARKGLPVRYLLVKENYETCGDQQIKSDHRVCEPL